MLEPSAMAILLERHSRQLRGKMALLPEFDVKSGKTYFSPGLIIGPQPGRIQICDLVQGDVTTRESSHHQLEEQNVRR